MASTAPSLPVLPSLRELSQPLFQKPLISRELRKKNKRLRKPLTLDEINRRRKIRYGLGCCTGMALVFGAKKLLGRLPFIGPFLSPIVSLIPTVLTGVVIGSLVIYGLEEGDLAAGPRRVRQEARRIGREIEGTVSDVHTDIRRISRKHNEEVARLSSSLEETLSRDVAPSITRAGRSLARQIEDGLMDMQDEIRRGTRKLEQAMGRV